MSLFPTSYVGSSSTGTLTVITAAATDTLLLAANSQRKGATIFNNSSAVLYLNYGATSSATTGYMLAIPSGGYYEVPFGYTGIFHGIWSAAIGDARVMELT
jgi:hypothetical protein